MLSFRPAPSPASAARPRASPAASDAQACRVMPARHVCRVAPSAAAPSTASRGSAATASCKSHARRKRSGSGNRTGPLTVCAGVRDSDGAGSGSGGGAGKFLVGFLVGGAVCGIAGVLFAPQLSKTLLKGKDSVGKFLYEDWTEEEEEDSLERTRQNLNDKIAQLNAAIDNFSTEADRGLSDKISKLNKDMEGMELAAAEGGGVEATGPVKDGALPDAV